MKFLHISDLHFGKRLENISLIDDQLYIVQQILNIIKSKSIDAILVAGDIYDRSIPPIEAVTLFDYTLKQFFDLNIPIYMVSGNHDSVERLSFGSSILKNSNIYISNRYDGSIQKETLSDEFGEIDIYLMPYINTINVRASNSIEVDNLSDAFKFIVENSNIDVSKRNILVAHQFVMSTPSEVEYFEEYLGGTQNVEASIFANAFDYTALGHIHKPWIDDRSPMAYAGALEPIDRNDEGSHGYIRGVLSDSETKIDFVPFASRSYITLDVPVTPEMTMRQLAEQVKALMGQNGRQNMFQIAISGFRDVDFELDERMLMRLGRVLAVHDHSVPDYDFQRIYDENKDNIIGMYIQHISEMEISDDLKAKALCYGMKAFYQTK